MPRMEGITGDWRKLRSDEFPDMCSSEKYYSAIQTNEDQIGRACGTCGGKKRNTNNILVGKPDGETLLNSSHILL